MRRWAASAGTKGRAGNDGSTGFECCCVDRTGPTQPCGGNGTAPAVGGSVQFTAFLTPQNATVLQVLNPTSQSQKVAVTDGEGGFEYTLPPGLATFVWANA